MPTINIAAEVTLTQGERDELERLRTQAARTTHERRQDEKLNNAVATLPDQFWAEIADTRHDLVALEQLKTVDRRRPGHGYRQPRTERSSLLAFIEHADNATRPADAAAVEAVAKILDRTDASTSAATITEMLHNAAREIVASFDPLYITRNAQDHAQAVAAVKSYDISSRVHRRATSIIRALTRQIRDIGVDLLRAELLIDSPTRLARGTRRYLWDDKVFDTSTPEHTRAAAAMKTVDALLDLVEETVDGCELAALRNQEIGATLDGYVTRRRARRKAATLSLDMLAAIGTKLTVFAELHDDYDPTFDTGSHQTGALNEANAASTIGTNADTHHAAQT